MARGISREAIFRDAQDRLMYLEALSRVKEEVQLTIYGFALMDNHVHLLLREGNEPLGTSMKRISISYAIGFNRKYDRNGYLFQGRFRSEPVEDDAYFLTALRYIHQNSVKAGLTPDCVSFRWCSYRAYLNGSGATGLLDTRLALDLLGGVNRFQEFMSVSNEGTCLDVQNDRIGDGELKKMFAQLMLAAGSKSIFQLSARARDEVLRQLKALDGASTRQIARVTGVSKSTVVRA